MSNIHTITYRPVNKHDLTKIKELYIEEFGFRRFTTNKHVLKSISSLYLSSVIQQSTYSLVAIRNHEPVGLIYGRNDTQPFLKHSLKDKLVSLYHFVKIILLSLFHLKAIKQALKFDHAYKKLSFECNKKFSGEVTTLLVSKSHQGFGIGKSLFHSFYDYLLKTKATSFFLYTDSWLSYGFYEKQGMIREGETPITLKVKTKKEIIDVYLYSLNVIDRQTIST
jgi:GNAT superfamily N-acetyltransferase